MTNMTFRQILQISLIALVGFPLAACSPSMIPLEPMPTAKSVDLPTDGLALYRVAISRERPERVRVQLILPHPIIQMDRLDLRDIPFRQQRRDCVTRVSCDGRILSSTEGAGYVLPVGCRTLDWEVEAEVLNKKGADVSHQKALFLPDGEFWVLPGAALLLRPRNATFSAVLALEAPSGTEVFSLLKRDEEDRLILPSAEAAPVFIVVGDPKVTEQTLEGMRLRYLTEGGADFDVQNVLKAHGRGLAYLDSLIPDLSVLPAEPRALDVIWIGIPRSRGMIGGAAGHRTLVVNYLRGSKDNTTAYRKLPLMVLFHEQCHNLFAGLPIWMTESLAQHYALKAMDKVGLFDEKSRKFIRTRFSVYPKDAPSLLELHRTYLQTKDAAILSAFYTQGSALWREIDETITSHSEKKHDLDASLPALLELDYNSAGNLPAGFVQILVEAGGQRMNEILTHRLGVDRSSLPEAAPGREVL